MCRTVSAVMEFGGGSLEEGCELVVRQRLKEGDGGVIAVDAKGNIVMKFNRYVHYITPLLIARKHWYVPSMC